MPTIPTRTAWGGVRSWSRAGLESLSRTPRCRRTACRTSSVPTRRTCSPARWTYERRRFTLAPGDGSVGNDTAGRTAEQVGTSVGGVTERVAELVSVGRLSAAVVALSMLAAFFWGAAHALTPGHGKAVVAAYLIGARGTARHAGYPRADGNVDPHRRGLCPRGRDPLPVTLHPARSPLPLAERSLRGARRRDRGLTPLPPPEHDGPRQQSGAHARRTRPSFPRSSHPRTTCRRMARR